MAEGEAGEVGEVRQRGGQRLYRGHRDVPVVEHEGAQERLVQEEMRYEGGDGTLAAERRATGVTQAVRDDSVPACDL